MVKNIIIAVVIIGVGVLVWFAFSKPVQAHAWVSIEPVQCSGNPWQGSGSLSQGTDEKEAIIKFYGAQGIEIFSVESKQVHEIVCQACNCSRGDKLYLEVSPGDAQKLIAEGFVPTPPPSSSQPILVTPPSAVTPAPIASVDYCDSISSSSFQSINQYEVGLGPNGPAMGHWYIQFKKLTNFPVYNNKTFEWQHSDFSESGTHTCKGNVLQVQLSNRIITAHYDEAKGTLTWDGVEYKKVK